MPRIDWALGTMSASSFQNHHNHDFHRRLNASLSYVTGSHNFKAGVNIANNRTALAFTGPGDLYTGYFFNGFPGGRAGDGKRRPAAGDRPGLRLRPSMRRTRGRWIRLTVNGGIRFDWFQSSVPGGNAGGRPLRAGPDPAPTPSSRTSRTGRTSNARFGAAFDLLGDGSTAVKFSAGAVHRERGDGRHAGVQPYLPLQPARLPAVDRPSTGTGPPSMRTGPPQFDEIGPSKQPQLRVVDHHDPSTNPNLPRASNWEYSGGIERQLGNGWALRRDVAPARLYRLRLVRQPEHVGERLVPGGHLDRAPTTPLCPRSPVACRFPFTSPTPASTSRPGTTSIPWPRGTIGRGTGSR